VWHAFEIFAHRVLLTTDAAVSWYFAAADWTVSVQSFDYRTPIRSAALLLLLH
jgi:hypothetical protein